MPQYVEAYGRTLEFPDGMSQADMAAAIRKSALTLVKPQPGPREAAPDPTEGNSFWQNAAAGLGKSAVDTARSVGQLARQGIEFVAPPKKSITDLVTGGAGKSFADTLGLPTQADIDEAARLDKPLMNTGGGVVGNLAGQVGAAFIPGTGQLKAAKMADAAWKAGGVAGVAKALGIAGGLGAAQNVVMNARAGDETLLGQAATGVGFGAGGQLAGAAVGAGVQGVRNWLSGSKGTAGRVLSDAAEMSPEQLLTAIQAGNRELVPGSKPTTAQAALIPGISQLQRGVRTLAPNQLSEVEAAQNAARLAALDRLAPGAGGRTSIEALKNLGDTAAAEAGAGRDAIMALEREKYGEAAASGAELLLPEVDRAKAVLKDFYPRGAIPSDPHGSAIHAFVDSLQGDAPVSLAEFDALRKQAGNKARALSRGVGESDPTAAAAWGAVKGLFDDSMDGAVAKSAKLQPTGQGPWGPEFGGLAGDPENAVAHLLRVGQGSVPAAATNKTAGAIDFVAGNPVQTGPGAFGLLHIDAKARDEALRRLPALAEDGVPYSRLQQTKAGILQPKGGRKGWYYLGDGDYEALLRGDYNFNPTDRPWGHTAYKIDADKKLPAGTGQSSSATSLTEPTQTSAPTTGLLSVPDIEASFKAFSDGLAPPAPLRDPRQYAGDLLGAITPAQAAPLQAGRSLRVDRKNIFESGPLRNAWRTGADGMPVAQGAELGAELVHSGKTQAEDLAALKRAVLERGPTMRAAKDYAITDLLQSATQRGADADVATLLTSKYGAWMDNRADMLRGLLDGGERGVLQNVREDLNRAARVETLGQGGNSNTADKFGSLGLLDSPWIDRGVNFLPMFGAKDAVRGLLGAVRESSRKVAAKEVSGALVDPEVALRSLQAYGLLGKPNAVQRRTYLGGLLGAPALDALND